MPAHDAETDVPVPDHADALVAAAHLDALLGALPTRQRTAVVLRLVEGRSEAETAAAMGTSTGAKLRPLLASDVASTAGGPR